MRESHFELLTPRQRRLDALAQLPDLLTHIGIHAFAAAANLEQLVRKVQRGHDCNAIAAGAVERLPALFRGPRPSQAAFHVEPDATARPGRERT